MWCVRRAAVAVVESLEHRTLLSGVPLSITQVTVPGGVELRITGTPGNDQITVKPAADGLLVGNTGGWNSDIAGSFQEIRVDAGAGNDSVVVDPAITTDCILYGGAGNDTLIGGSGNDRLYGGPGKNLLNGGAGDDILVCLGSTKDTLIGGPGRDSFWTDSNASAERIVDLSPEESADGNVHRVASLYSGASSSKSRTNLAKALSVRATPEPRTDGAYVDFSSHPLFADSGPSQDDIAQGNVGDCYFLAALGATAKLDPWRLRQSVVDMGDGTYLVQFVRGASKVFVRVDGQLPTSDGLHPEYADFGAQGSLWVALMEKAYAVFRTGANSYASIGGGWMDEAFMALGGTASSIYYGSDGTDLLRQIQDELVAGKAVTYGTNTVTDGAPLLGGHAYVVEQVITDASGAPVAMQLRNPWGVDGAGNDGANDGYVTITAQQAFDALLGFVSASV